MEPVRFVVKFAFDGLAFRGYARQPEGMTVEDDLIRSLVLGQLIDDAATARFTSAGRVDKGVSAIGAAAAFDTCAREERVLRTINANTDQLVAHSIARGESGFDPRRRASARWYRYHFPQDEGGEGLDIARMRNAAKLFEGEHDMSAFARLEGRDPLRVVHRTGVERRSGAMVLDVWGRSFLWNQVRRMATAIRMVGAGETGLDDLELALRTGQGGPFAPAPPHGLVLMDVLYDDLEFRTEANLPKSTSRRLAEAYHRERCSLKVLEYLRERVRY